MQSARSPSPSSSDDNRQHRHVELDAAGWFRHRLHNRSGFSTGTTNLLSAAATFPQYVWTGAPQGTSYIRVRALNGCGAGPSSNEVTATVITPLPPPPLMMCSADEPQFGGIRTHAAGLFDCKWRDRTSLTVTFLGGDPIVRAKVQAITQEWSPYTGIALNFVSSPDADIRIAFDLNAGTWSKLGPCNRVPGEPTMNYSWLYPNTSDVEYRRAVLHEFGHAIGLVHEHQSPAANIPWDIPKVYEWCSRQNPPWDKAKCDHNMFNRRVETNYTEFDRNSIMLYAIDNSLTIGDFETPWNTELSFLDKTFTRTWYTNGPWQSWPGLEHEYLVGNWDRGAWAGFPGDKLAVRRDQYVLMSLNYDGIHDFVQGYGNGTAETQYLTGDWNGDGLDNLAVRSGNCVNMDFNFDGAHDLRQCYGNGTGEDQYLVGDWNGDGRDNLAVRKGNCVNMDFNFDGAHDLTQCYGNGSSEDQYLAGDWDGDGRDNLAVRRGNCVYMDFNFDGGADLTQCYGNGVGLGWRWSRQSRGATWQLRQHGLQL